MSIWTSLYTGSSGLGAHGNGIGVVGDNIANVSTIGYKSSRASFQDVISGAAPNGQRLGAGVRMGAADVQFGQGSLQQTENPLDMAIRGNGFFVLQGNHSGVDGTYYSRDGRFHLDNEGRIVSQEGLRLQGYVIGTDGAAASAPTDLTLDPTSPPSATTRIDMGVNLDSSLPVASFDPFDPAGTSSFSTSTTVYDSLGAAHRVDIYFANDGAGAWQWYAMVDSGDLGGIPGTPTEIGSGALTFTPDGALDTETPNGWSVDFPGAQPGQSVELDFGDAITTDGGTGLAGSTQFASPSSVTRSVQDGYAQGSLADVSVAEDGTIMGVYSNGQSRAIARVALADFASETGLKRAGGQMFRETPQSGEAMVAAAATGGRGAVSSGMLEGSNVDLGGELVTMIAYQRAFQANARTVSTADEMLAEIANLKR